MIKTENEINLSGNIGFEAKHLKGRNINHLPFAVCSGHIQNVER